MILGRRLKMSMLKKSSFLLCLIILMIGNVWFISLKNDDSSLIGAYVDGEYASNIPSKDAGYVVEKIVCDNEAVGDWNYNDWGLLVKNMTKKSKCNVYFRKGIKLADTITLVDATGKCPTVNDDGSVNVTSAESENSLLCMAPDNYGTSYYFRGNVQNNYVYFANLYWRIIRINGDGSIRMIYDGTTAHENGEANEDRIIGTSAFNEKGDDNAYVGYMYGTAGSSTYEETHANINDSKIKKYLDTWYKNTLNATEYERYLTDNEFLGNRSLGSNEGNVGFSNNKTLYYWYYLANSSLKTSLHGSSEDNYTISSSVVGNKKLNYPIGLISMEETILSGAYNVENKKFFLYSGINYWTMTADSFMTSNNLAHNRIIGSSGCAGYCGGVAEGGGRVVWEMLGVKPVINLKPNSLKLGDGTISNAYRVS